MTGFQYLLDNTLAYTCTSEIVKLFFQVREGNRLATPTVLPVTFFKN